MRVTVPAALVSRLVKKGSPRLEIVANRDCHMVRHTIPRGVKVDRAFIELNYYGESPFPGFFAVYWKHGSLLHIWFVRLTEDEQDKGRLLIPQSLLIAYAFGKAGKSHIVTCSLGDAAEVVALDNGAIVGQYTFGSLEEGALRQKFQLICRQHALAEPESITIAGEDYTRVMERGLQRLPFYDLPGFWQASPAESGQTLQRAVRLLPTIALCLVLFAGLDIYATWSMEERVRDLDEEIAAIRTEVAPVMEMRQQQEQLLKYWRDFAEQEIYPPSQIELYFAAAANLADVGGTLTRWERGRGAVTFRAEMADATAFLTRMRQVPGFESLRIDGSVTKNRDAEGEEAAFSIALLEAQR